MQAAVAEVLGAPLQVKEVETPAPGPGEILLRLEACGVCFTDVRIVEQLGGPLLPLIPGHEPVGVVAAVGDGVEGVAVGDRVGAHALFTCHECAYCRAGEEEACVRGFAALAGLGRPGGYAEYLVLPAEHAIPVPPELSAAEAAPFFCAGLTTYAALRNAGAGPGSRVAVIGIGGLGHLAVPIAAALGAEVYAVTGSPDKKALARERGAVFAGSAEAAAAALTEAGGAHVLLNTADSLDVVAAMVPAMAKQGTVLLVAADGDVLPLPPNALLGLQLRVMGSFFGSRQDMREVLALAVEHGIRAIVEEHPLAEVNAVHDRLRANAVRYRAVLTF
jgi:propanol-preferring alcohol dehydrogenase